jgi:hypothetical protein
MARARLNVTDLSVTSFEIPAPSLTSVPQDEPNLAAGGGFCCTGCDSGCGLFPTAGGCQSAGNTYEYPGCGDTVDICQA